MSYHVYTTQALVLKRMPHETSVTYMLYTKDFGRIFALATGVRKSESKLRYALQEFSLCTVSLVKGKHTWRIISAQAEENLYIGSPKYIQPVVASLCSVAVRLIQGQQSDTVLYDILIQGLKTLSLASKEHVGAVEIVLLIRMLATLGYVEPHEDVHFVLSQTGYDSLFLDQVVVRRAGLVGIINTGFTESQL